MIMRERYAHRSRGFALIEILVAITILSVALLAIISGVSAGIVAITGNKNLTQAVITAKTKFNEFQTSKFRGADITDEPVKEYPGYAFSRKTTRFEHAIFGPISAKKVEIIVSWSDRNRKKSYSISYVYPER